MADVVQKFFEEDDFMAPEQDGHVAKKCCGRCKEKKVVHINDARRVAKMKTEKK